MALNGMRAYLVNAGLPCCFWPFAGHCYAYNESWSSHNGSRTAPRKQLLGGKEYHELFSTGQLVFFKPAPTIYHQAKTDPRLVPGIFLDYYVAGGHFTGQYVVCDLSDFKGKNLATRIGKEHFKLHLHRTEVVRMPSGYGVDEPIFPLRKKYFYSNCRIEGLESDVGKPMNEYDPNEDDYG